MTVISTYEQLEGTLGRTSLYRPRRFRSIELVSPAANPRLRIHDIDHKLLNVSTTGVLLSVAAEQADADWAPHVDVEIALVIHDAVVQSALASVSRVERRGSSMQVALSLRHGHFDLDRLRALDADLTLRKALVSGAEQQYGLLPEAFREAVARLVHFVQFYRRSLETHIGSRALDEAAMRELAASVYPPLLDKYAELRHAAARASLPLFADPAALKAAKSYVETLLTPLLRGAPIVERAYGKPLGYPGDYLVMQLCYDNAFEGDTVFAKVFHKIFVQHPMSTSLTTRKNYVVEQLAREHTRLLEQDPHGELSVTSIGCGPAREVGEYIEQRGQWTGAMRFRLFDQEERTLELAYLGAHGRLVASGCRGQVQCFNLSFGQLVKQRSLLSGAGPQHLIYSTGLFDYLAPRTAQALIAALYEALREGGLLLIGNAAGPSEEFFCPEFILDWSLIYRTREQMCELAAQLPPTAQVEVEHEAGGSYWFLRVRKPL